MPALHRIDLLEPLQLTDATPVAMGKERVVFMHPKAPGLIVKVIRPDRRSARAQADQSWLRRGMRLRHYTLFFRELREYLALRARAPTGELPLARLLGLVETDLGLGLVSERVEYPPGTLAPTLKQLLSAGHDRAPLDRAVVCLGEDLVRFDVVVNDLNPGNLVVCNAADGGLRFVLVDGFGEKNLLPVRSMFRSLNRYNTRLRVVRLLALIRSASTARDAVSGAAPL